MAVIEKCIRVNLVAHDTLQVARCHTHAQASANIIKEGIVTNNILAGIQSHAGGSVVVGRV